MKARADYLFRLVTLNPEFPHIYIIVLVDDKGKYILETQLWILENTVESTVKIEWEKVRNPSYSCPGTDLGFGLVAAALKGLKVSVCKSCSALQGQALPCPPLPCVPSLICFPISSTWTRGS